MWHSTLYSASLSKDLQLHLFSAEMQKNDKSSKGIKFFVLNKKVNSFEILVDLF